MPRTSRPRPCVKNGFFTFGSFNNLAKVNPKVVALWAMLLRAIPDSRLVMKNPSLTDKSTANDIRPCSPDAGIPGERLDLLGYIADDGGHLGAYGRIDIALDTFPYNGTTTTCEALWMGVPVISLRGDRHSARGGCEPAYGRGIFRVDCRQARAVSPYRAKPCAESAPLGPAPFRFA